MLKLDLLSRPAYTFLFLFYILIFTRVIFETIKNIYAGTMVICIVIVKIYSKNDVVPTIIKATSHKD